MWYNLLICLKNPDFHDIQNILKNMKNKLKYFEYAPIYKV